MHSYLLTYPEFEKNIIQKCKDAKIISFDVFDTLVKRNTSSPNDVFILLDSVVEKKYGIKNFGFIRNKFAHSVIRKDPYATLHDIYLEIFQNLKNEVVFQIEKEEECIETELVTCNGYIKNIYDYFVKEKKKIIAISDMYLSKTTIGKMLVKCGYQINDLYVSCECHAVKSNGSLFEYVANELNLDKQKWVHIGDSKIADVIGAHKAGIMSCGIKRNLPHIDSSAFLKKMSSPCNYKYFKAIADNNISVNKNYYYSFGYGIVGVLVFNFTKWLIKKCNQYGIKKIFFFSRDGYVLKKAFDSVNNTDIISHYLYVSRRATRVPYLSVKNSIEDIIQTIPPTKMISIKSILEIFGLEPKDHINICLNYGFEIENRYLLLDLKKSEKFRSLIEELRGVIIKQAKYEYLIFESYLMQEDFSGKLAVVDVGWNCSMQSYIENMPVMQKQNINMFGFYVGINETTKKTNNSEGYISDYRYKMDVTSVSSFVGLMESIFLSLEGSTKKYIKKKNVVEAELLPYEYEVNSNEIAAFKEIHKGIFDFVQDANSFPHIDYFLLNGYDAYIPLKTFGTNPKEKDIEKFFDFRYFSEEIVKFADSKKILYYLAHPKVLSEDLYMSRWKIGFLKRLLKLPLPYYYLFTKIRR